MSIRPARLGALAFLEGASGQHFFCPSGSLLWHHIWLKTSHMVQLANIHFEDLATWFWTFGALLGTPEMVKIKPFWTSIRSWNSNTRITRIRYSFCLSVLESIQKSRIPNVILPYYTLGSTKKHFFHQKQARKLQDARMNVSMSMSPLMFLSSC